MKIKSPYKVKKVDFECDNGAYIYRREIIDDSEYGGNGNMKMINCYSSYSGEWIGGPKEAAMLCCKYNLTKLQKISYSDGGGCQLGFNVSKQKWYGWSHRAIFGFGVGSECKVGHCGYTPGTVDELYLSVTEKDENGYSWKDKENVQKIKDGIRIRHEMSDLGDPDENGRYNPPFKKAEPKYQTIQVGRGEWKAETLEEAKQMAIDFAKGVS